MDNVKLIELQTLIRCGELDCLRNCCGKLAFVQAILRDMTPRDILLFEKMLCACPVVTTPRQEPNCYQKMVRWAKSNVATVDSLQSLFTLATSFGIPGLDQLAAIALAILEDIEDAGRTDENDTATEEVVERLCAGFVWLDELRRTAIGNLPASLQGIGDLLTRSNIATIAADTCCAGQRAPTGQQPPALPGTPAPPPALPQPGGEEGLPTTVPQGAVPPPPVITVGTGGTGGAGGLPAPSTLVPNPSGGAGGQPAPASGCVRRQPITPNTPITTPVGGSGRVCGR